jgi:predicted nucleotidyltransferase
MPLGSDNLFNPDYADMAGALIGAGAEFMLVGGYAVLLHGYPRTTFDIDFWVRPSPGNAPKVMEALHRFGAPLRDVSAADFDHPDMVYQIGVPPCRIDILTRIDGVEWEEAAPRAVEGIVNGMKIKIIGLEDLIRNKRASGRAKDAADAEELERISGGKP